MKRFYTRLLSVLALLLLLSVVFASCAAGKNYAPNDRGDGSVGSTEDVNMGLLGKEESANVPNDPNRKIIKTYHLSAETKGYEDATKALHELIQQNGGYVQESSSNNQSYNSSSNRYSRNANYVIRIPAENAEGFVNND